MRVVPLLVTTLLLAAPVFAQSTSTTTAPPAKAAAAADTPPAHPITPAQVHEIFETMRTKQLQVQMMRGIMVNIRKSFPPFIPKDVIDDLETSLERIDFEPIALAAYQKHISTKDAAQIIAFYKTDAGRHLIGAMPQISREMQMNGAKEGMKVVQEVIARHKDEIEAAAVKYKQEHSDAPKITSPN